MTAMPRRCLEKLDLFFTIKFCNDLDLLNELIRSLKPYSNQRCNASCKFQKKTQKISPCGKISRTWSFHVVVLQRTVTKCTKIYNACA